MQFCGSGKMPIKKRWSGSCIGGLLYVFDPCFVILAITNDMLYISALKNVIPNFFIAKTFECRNDMR